MKTRRSVSVESVLDPLEYALLVTLLVLVTFAAGPILIEHLKQLF